MGTLLFLLYINDLCAILNCKMLCFADDLKIFSEIRSLEDCFLLQSKLNIINEWCKSNKLTLNVQKCKVVTYSRKKTTIIHSYAIDDMALERCVSIKDLGVIFDAKLTFADHIEYIVSSALKSYGFIIRNCRNFYNIDSLIALFNTLVRSKLEYASIIWYPIYDCYIKDIERVHRKFLKYLAFKTDGIYPEHGIEYDILCSRFDFVSLQSRRGIASMKFLYKLLHNSIDCIDIIAQLNFNVPQVSRSNLMFRCNRARTNMLIKSPIHVMCNNYNKICRYCDVFNSSFNDILRTCKTHYH